MDPATPWPGPVPDITSSVSARACGGPGGGPGRNTAPAEAACSRSTPRRAPGEQADATLDETQKYAPLWPYPLSRRCTRHHPFRVMCH